AALDALPQVRAADGRGGALGHQARPLQRLRRRLPRPRRARAAAAGGGAGGVPRRVAAPAEALAPTPSAARGAPHPAVAAAAGVGGASARLPPSTAPPLHSRDMADALDYRGRRVLVTGASGFIGRRLCRRLRELGAEVEPA